MMWSGGFGLGEMLLVMLIMLLLLGGVIVLAVVVARALGGSRSHSQVGSDVPSAASHSALDILKERYARGEITKEQYDEIRRDIVN